MAAYRLGGDCEAGVVAVVRRSEASQRWVRGYVDGVTVVDSRTPLLFWEERFPVPHYAYDPADVRMDLLEPAAGEPPTEPGFWSPQGPVSQWFDLQVGDRRLRHAAWVRDEPALADRVILSWQPGLLDRWTEEDEEVFGHPRDPYHRVDALPSSRRVTVAVDGVQVADSRTPVVLFETGLPTRYYLPVDDVDLDRLTAGENRTFCPYKGEADRYWGYPGRSDLANFAWSYTDPGPAVAPIAGRIAFYNELVDLRIDGELEPRPASPFFS